MSSGLHSFLEALSQVKRIVVKIGTNSLRGEVEGLNLELMDGLARQISTLRAREIDCILVTSGAVRAGAFAMNLLEPPKEVSKRQALAAIGQSRLMQHYKKAFAGQNLEVAQVLLTRDNLDRRERYLNARHTLETLLSWGVLPIINENDTVAVEELRFGDNDQLSSMIAGKLGAELLVILTDVEGVFDRPPSDPRAVRIRAISWKQLAEIQVSEGTGTSFALGGMRSKLEAVRLATRAGILVNIAPGRLPGVLLKVLDGDDVGTWFEPPERRISGRKRWLAFGKRLCDGRIIIDEGAEEAILRRRSSLLPSGVLSVEGSFDEGDLAQVVSLDGREVARGLVQYSSDQLLGVIGKKTSEITELLGTRQNYEAIHRDDMIVLEEEEEPGPA